MPSYLIYEFVDAQLETAAAALAATTATSTFTSNAHGLPNGTPVVLTSISGMTNVALNTTYYVVNTATNTFQIAATVGGSPITVGTGSPNVIAKVSTDIYFANQLESERLTADIEWSGDGQQRQLNITTGMTLTITPDSLPMDALETAFSKTAVTSGLPAGMTRGTWMGDLTESKGVSVGLRATANAIKQASGVESTVELILWIPQGTLTYGGAPGLTSGEKGAPEAFSLSTNRATQDILGGALPGVPSGGAFYLIGEK